jgi:hypothetical protein
MESNILVSQEWEMILESLKYSKLKFEEYDKYPSADYKQKRIEEITQLISKIKSFRYSS